MKKLEVIFKNIVGILDGCLLGIAITMTIMSVKTKSLENKVVASYDKGYEDGENQAQFDFIDVLIENAVLKERLEHQPSDEKYILQIIDDFELVIELQQYYYQENITSHSFGDWLQINYPSLYQRIESYF